MKGRRGKGPTRVATALVIFVGVNAVFSTITVLLFATPASPTDLAVTFAIVMIVNASWLALVLAWERVMEKRRRDRLGG